MLEYLGSFLVNFLLVFVSMGLFFAPFLAVFWYRHRHEISEARPHFNYFMEQFMRSRESNYFVAAWAAAEALFWFIIPEFLLILVVFMKIHRKFDLVKYDIIGTVIGTLVGFAIYVDDTVFLRVPYIYQKMLDQAHHWFETMGVWGLIHQPFSGVPYKAFIHEAQDFQFFVPAFLIIAIVVRMFRYVIMYEATKALYPLLHTFVRRHYAWLFVLATAIFTALLMRVSEIYR